MNIILASIISFVLGEIISVIIIIFISGAGKSNEKHEYYDEGFIDGYNKAKEEKE